MTEDAVEIFSAAKRKGSDDGRRSLNRICLRVADSTRMSSSADASTASRPRTMFTSVGKKEMSAAMTIFGA